jgi:fibronectin-binding autotransporter adhesin
MASHPFRHRRTPVDLATHSRPVRRGRHCRPVIVTVAATSAAMLPPLTARADAPPANPPIVITGGVTTIGANNGVTTINGTDVNNYAGGIVVYGDGNVVSDSDGQGFNSLSTGVLFVDDGGGSSDNYFGSTQITLSGGTFEYHGGPAASNPQSTPSTTVTNMTITTGGVISARPQGGGGTIGITNLSLNQNATVTFESEWAPIGTGADLSADIGKVTIGTLKYGGTTLSANQDGGTNGNAIIGGWATVASYGGPGGNTGSGLPGFASFGPLGIQEVNYSGTSIGASSNVTDNIRTTGEALDGNVKPVYHINSLVSEGGGGGGTDVLFNNGAQLILESGGLIMGEGGHWLRADPNFSGTGIAGTITAGALGNYNLYATTTQDGDYRVWNVQITDNGANPVKLIKGGPGRFILDPQAVDHETYTGGTIINDGILEITKGGQTGTFAPHSTVTVNGGGTLQIDATDGLGWINGGNPTDPNNGEVTVTVNPGGRLFAQGGARVTLSDTLTLNGGILASSATNGDGNGNYSIYGQVNATSAPTGPAQITAATITLQSAQTIFNVAPGGNGPVDLRVTSNIGEFQGSNGLVKNGIGVMVLGSAGTYTGGTTINAGTLRVQNVNALGTGPITLAGGTLQFASHTLGSAGTSVSGFANFELNTNGGSTASPVISSDNSTLTITDASGGEARSAFFNSPVPFNNTNGFTASFVYQNLSGNTGDPADGVTFTLQHDPRGSGALGDSGGAFGYGGGAAIVNSGAVEFNIYGGAAGGRGIAFGTNGSVPGNAGTGPVDISNGDPVQVSLNYNGVARSLQETLTDTTNNNTFTTTFYGIDYQSLVGGTSAFLGFTGGTGGSVATQTISNFNFTSNAFTAPSTETYTNAVAVVGDAKIDLTGGQSVTFGTLSIGANNLTVTSSDTSATPYTLTSGAVTLGGNATFTVSNSAGGAAVSLSPGAISGSFGITKAGSGALLLAGNSNYTGPTIIQAGTVLANNATSSTGAGPVTVQAGAKLGGIGLIAAPTTINAGGIISAGDAATVPGKLTINAATIFTQGSGVVGDSNNGATYLWKINSATGGAGSSTGWDQLQLQGLSLASGTSGSAVTIEPVSFSGVTPGAMANFNKTQLFKWAVINVPATGALPPASNFVLDTNALSTFASANGVSTSAFSILEGADPGGGNDVYVQFNPAPEPTSLTLLGLGAAGLMLRRRRAVYDRRVDI